MTYALPSYSLRVDRSACCADAPVPPKCTDAEAVVRLARELIPDDEREHFLALFVDTRNVLKGTHEVSTGNLTSSLVHPRESFRAAVMVGASAVIFAHNHPSGDPAPSREDVNLTRCLWEAGKVLGIRVLDHVILGDGADRRHYSFASDDAMPPTL